MKRLKIFKVQVYIAEPNNRGAEKFVMLIAAPHSTDARTLARGIHTAPEKGFSVELFGLAKEGTKMGLVAYLKT